MGRFVSMESVYRVGGRVGGQPRPPSRLSHAIQEVCHRLLVLIVGSEAVSEASGHLAVELLGGGQVAALGEDLLLVGVAGEALHGFVSVDGISLQGQGISQAPGRTLL